MNTNDQLVMYSNSLSLLPAVTVTEGPPLSFDFFRFFSLFPAHFRFVSLKLRRQINAHPLSFHY